MDVFLLDWGKPRTVITEFARKGEGKVSCWRQLFVANEYNELQVERITNVDATYLFALFFLEASFSRSFLSPSRRSRARGARPGAPWARPRSRR